MLLSLKACIIVSAAVLTSISAVAASQGGTKKQEGDSCLARYGTLEGFDGVFHYFEVPSSGRKCEDSGDLICQVEEDEGVVGVDYRGTCKTAKCFEPLDDYEGKVTICHRTCSEKNPWVRITIDASAWVEHSCGHTIESCNRVDPSYWGDYEGDYILKIHGSRQEVASLNNNNAKKISDYWKQWEPACPSIRNGNCCSFSGENGYNCCGRAGIDPPMPGGPTPSPVPLPTLPPVPTTPPVAPIASPTFAPISPVASPTLAPISPVASPTLAPIAPVASPTLAPISPVANPTLAPTSLIVSPTLPTMAPVSDTLATLLPTLSPVAAPSGGNGGGDPLETPKCYNRRLQDIEQLWNISVPEFRYQRSLSFHLDFEISDFISSEAMISNTILDSTCTNSYEGAGLLHARGLRLPIGNNKQRVGLAMWVDPEAIAQDTEIYSEGVVNNQVMANIAYCVRFALHTPPNTPGGSLEVNFIEVIVSFDADLTDGFSIGTLNAAPYDKCEVEADEAFEVEGYFCQDGMEATPLASNPVINQGEQIKVCVRPVQRALDQGIRMKALREFTWSLEGSDIEQEAIVDYAPASNYLTNLYCQGGHAICHFESMLYATFFRGVGRVMGSGVAELQFGGEVSPTSVSPKTRRSLQQSNRRVEEDVPAAATPSAKFSLDTTLAASSWDSSSGSNNHRSMMSFLSSLAAATTAALVLM